jgi:hypothetical protein
MISKIPLAEAFGPAFLNLKLDCHPEQAFFAQ